MHPTQKKLTEKQREALSAYSNWRPRLARGAKWAGTAALLSNVVGPTTSTGRTARKYTVPITVAAGTAGIGDHFLQEAAKRNREMAKITAGAFDKSAEDPVLSGLYAVRSTLAKLARDQLEL